MIDIKYIELTLVRRVVFILAWVGFSSIFFLFAAIEIIRFSNAAFEPGSAMVKLTSGSLLVLIGVFGILLPALYLVKFVGIKHTLFINSNTVKINTRGKTKVTFNITDISTMELELLSVNSLLIYDKNENILAELKPYEAFTKKENQSLTIFLKHINKVLKMREIETTKTQLGAEYKVIKYSTI